MDKDFHAWTTKVSDVAFCAWPLEYDAGNCSEQYGNYKHKSPALSCAPSRVIPSRPSSKGSMAKTRSGISFSLGFLDFAALNIFLHRSAVLGDTCEEMEVRQEGGESINAWNVQR